jgi:uncharacterized glyoxalase superfamily protein PhnB
MAQVILRVCALERSLDFYAHQLGIFRLEGDPQTDGDGALIGAVLTMGAVCVQLSAEAAQRGARAELHIALTEEYDIDALYARVQRLGVPLIAPLCREGWGEKRFVVQDPDGVRVSVAQPCAPPPAPLETQHELP